MTLFNVRLGIWLPNPSKATSDELRLARPRNSLMALIDEMLGETTDDSQAIYLSDGGHFENLGLYEMFRRRCSSILVVDAGADEACSLIDLGNAIRKAEIDFGIRVAMQEPMHVYPRIRLEGESDLTAAALGFACGDIDYGGGHTGQLRLPEAKLPGTDSRRRALLWRGAQGISARSPRSTNGSARASSRAIACLVDIRWPNLLVMPMPWNWRPCSSRHSWRGNRDRSRRRMSRDATVSRRSPR